MTWLILVGAYAAIGIVIFLWQVRDMQSHGPERGKRAARTAVLFPELCLLWPFILFLKFRHAQPKATAPKADH